MAYRNKLKYTGGKMSDSRISWVQTVLGTFEIRQHAGDDPDEEDGKGDKEGVIGYNLALRFARAGQARPITLSLTSLTMDELREVRQLFEFAFDLAEPVVIERDRVAQDAAAQGDDSYARTYRGIPVHVVREGKILTYSEGVLFGPDGLPYRTGRGGRAGEPSGGIRGAGDGLADEAPEGPGAQDDEPAPDQS